MARADIGQHLIEQIAPAGTLPEVVMWVDDPLTRVEDGFAGGGQPILTDWYLVLVAAHLLLPEDYFTGRAG